MAVHATRLIPLIFLALAPVFFVAGLRSGASPIARRVRMRIAWIFLIVGIGLLILQSVSASP